MLQTVLIVLTLGHADGTHLSLTQADNPAACEQKSQALGKILTDAGYTIGAGRCVPENLRFTPYQPGAHDMANRFRVTLPLAGGATVEALGPDETCTPAPDADPAVFCARSAQQLLAD